VRFPVPVPCYVVTLRRSRGCVRSAVPRVLSDGPAQVRGTSDGGSQLSEDSLRSHQRQISPAGTHVLSLSLSLSRSLCLFLFRIA
jgi:hypothetical protein